MTGNPIRWADLTSRTKLPSGFRSRAISILGGDPGSFTMSSTIRAALFGSTLCANVVRNGNFFHLLSMRRIATGYFCRALDCEERILLRKCFSKTFIGSRVTPYKTLSCPSFLALATISSRLAKNVYPLASAACLRSAKKGTTEPQARRQ